jgi:hypothetical protein
VVVVPLRCDNEICRRGAALTKLKKIFAALFDLYMVYAAVKRNRTGPTRQYESGPDKKVRAEVTETLLGLYIERGLVYVCMMIDELPN